MQRTDVVGERYVLRDSLGRGGMGEVYLARDELLGREVAVKLLRAQHAENAQFVERFRREAKNAAALSHQNIVSVYDAGESPDGTPYMAMEYVGGGTLAERIETESPLDALEAAGITLQVACALQEAHEKGVIHRDIKPHNIFLAERAEASASSSATSARAGGGAGGVAPGSVKVGDFGIARAGAETAMTETSLIIGTVRYLSPEQAMGTEVGPQSDLYSLGIVLYEMLTGRVPFDAENPIAIAMKHVSEAPTPPREINPGVPEGIQTITLRLLSKDPEDRYAEAAALIADLERVGRGLPPEGLPPTNPGAEDAENETDFLQHPPATRTSGPSRGRQVLPSHHPVRRTRRRRRIGLLMVFALLAGGLALVGGEDRVAALSSVYNGFSPEGGAQRVEGMRSVEASSAVEAPITRLDIPDVVGDTEATAEKTLEEAGFEVEKRSRETSERQEGTVLSQEPNPEKRVQRGATVTITVAKAPAKAPAKAATATVPDLTGLDVGEAGGRLSEAGLVLGEQGEAYSDSTPVGLIVSQGSLSGAELQRGASVGVTVSLGPEPAAATTTVPEPELAAGPTPAPTPESSPAQELKPAPGLQSQPDPAPVQQEPAQAPAQEPVQQEPATQPAPEPQPEPSAQPEPAPEPGPSIEPTPVPGVPVPEQAPSEPGNPPSGEPAGADSVVPATPEPVVPTMPDVFDN